MPLSEPVVLYSSADCWRGGSISFLNVARGLVAHGTATTIVSLDNAVARHFTAAGIDAVVLPRGRGESVRLRRLLIARDASALLVDRAHDLRVAALATIGIDVPVICR